jgi:F0F1-type ATP synthase assembly protein I
MIRGFLSTAGVTVGCLGAVIVLTMAIGWLIDNFERRWPWFVLGLVLLFGVIGAIAGYHDYGSIW